MERLNSRPIERQVSMIRREAEKLIDLSIIIPVFNEQERIEQTLGRLSEYLSQGELVYELIVVDDGSTDATSIIVHSCRNTVPHLSLHVSEKNQGKGAAVKTGMLAARGALRLFLDADLSTDIGCLDSALGAIERGADIAVGSRQIDGFAVAVPQRFGRRIAGYGFRMVVNRLFRLPVKDSQNGFKLFTAEAAEKTFRRLQTRGWAFDVEILVRANDFGFNVKEVPVTWRDDRRSNVRIRHAPRTIVDLIRTWIALRGLTAIFCRQASPKGELA